MFPATCDTVSLCQSQQGTPTHPPPHQACSCLVSGFDRIEGGSGRIYACVCMRVGDCVFVDMLFVKLCLCVCVIVKVCVRVCVCDGSVCVCERERERESLGDCWR